CVGVDPLSGTLPAVRDVVEAVSDVDRGALAHKEQKAGATLEDERGLTVARSWPGSTPSEDSPACLHVWTQRAVPGQEPAQHEGATVEVRRRLHIEMDVRRLKPDLEVTPEDARSMLVRQDSSEPEQTVIAVDRFRSVLCVAEGVG